MNGCVNAMGCDVDVVIDSKAYLERRVQESAILLWVGRDNCGRHCGA